MKKLILIAGVSVSAALFNNASAQLRLSVNIGSQPVWGPAGYDHADYYYFPDIDAYYYVPNRQYIYMSNGRWQFSTSLPRQFRSFDVNTGYKVVINEPTPYKRASFYRSKYASYKGRHDQQIIRNSHDEKYWQIKDHPDHNKWNNRNRNNNNNNNHNNNGGHH